MFDTLSDRLGSVFDRLKGQQAFPAKVGTGFAFRKRAHIAKAFPAKVGTGFAFRKRACGVVSAPMITRGSRNV